MESSRRRLVALFDVLWRDYIAITPDAPRIHALLEQRGDRIVNDHIALRTFGVPTVDIHVLARAFIDLGYRAGGQYVFEQKQLIAQHYEPPAPDLPKVFISQLRVEAFSSYLQEIVARLVAEIPKDASTHPHFVANGRPWSVSFETYERLLVESEYAAWMAAFGFRANHFTVDVGRLSSVDSLEQLNQVLVDSGFELNHSGGLIKGSKQQYLEQSSTRARSVPVRFSDRTASVRSCYYEFARRYPTADGTLFSGFVTQSADKLFESTDTRVPVSE